MIGKLLKAQRQSMDNLKILSTIYFSCRFCVYLLLFVFGKFFGFEKNQIIVLCYHSLAEDDWRFSIDPGVFKKQINYMTQHFKPITIEELKLYLEGKAEINYPSFLLSFDDGYKDIYQIKDFLREKGITPVIFLLSSPNSADFSQLKTRRGFLSWKETRQLLNDGWIIGSHGRTHTDFLALNEDKAREEIIESKKKLEKILGVKVSYFAYPKGRYKKEVLSKVKDSYELAFSMDSGFVDRQTDNLKIPRIGIDRSHSFIEFKAVVNPLVVVFKKSVGKFLF